jgi:tyrosyl-tRNA synthetase
MKTKNHIRSLCAKINSMDAIEHLLTRGVDTIYPTREALEKVLRSGKKLTLYQGFDPTGTQLHIGHAVAIRKLRQFQDLGHKVIFLIGDFTAVIGDPSGKAQSRPILSREQVLNNAKEYKRQVFKILCFDGVNPVEIKFNSEWLSKLTFEDVLKLAGHFTVQQMIERDMFQERIKRQDEIGLHEFLYPLMVGYDSVAMNVDLELGGSDQTFNMLAGRKLVAQMLKKEKFVMTVPLLTDAKGVKIGKTEGNVIGISDIPSTFFAKIMSLGDDSIIPCFTLLTDLSDNEIDSIKKLISDGANPMELKKRLAFELTKEFNSEQQAVAAQKEFEQVHQKGNISDVSTLNISLTHDDLTVKGFLKKLVEAGHLSSLSEAKRLLDAGAIKILDFKTQKEKAIEEIADEDIIKKGAKLFIRIKLT